MYSTDQYRSSFAHHSLGTKGYATWHKRRVASIQKSTSIWCTTLGWLRSMAFARVYLGGSGFHIFFVPGPIVRAIIMDLVHSESWLVRWEVRDLCRKICSGHRWAIPQVLGYAWQMEFHPIHVWVCLVRKCCTRPHNSLMTMLLYQV